VPGAPPQDNRYYLQFNEEPWTDFQCGDAEDVRYTPNAAGDGGFGLYQLTWFDSPARIPNAQELWDWKENVHSGVAWLEYHQEGAETHMAIQRALCHQACPDDDWPVPPETLGVVLFADNTDRPIEHAVALKRYNGATGGQYVVFSEYWQDWEFNRLNTENPPFNYVERVCLTVP